MFLRLFTTTCLISLWTAIVSQYTHANPDETQFTYLGGVVRAYEIELIQLALEKTKDEYGEFKLIEAREMTEARGFASLLEAEIPNGIRISTFTQKKALNPAIRYTLFPVYLGILGYRVCYINNDTKKNLGDKNIHEKVKKLVHGQGNLWLDTVILRENGYRVVTGNQMENLYKMLAAKRMDLFCRGTNEIESEKPIAQQFDNITLDNTFAFFYHLPFFAYTSAENKTVSQRLLKGFVAAYTDGSMQTLWQKYFGLSVTNSNLKDRIIIPLQNPQLKNIDITFDQYFYKP